MKQTLGALVALLALAGCGSHPAQAPRKPAIMTFSASEVGRHLVNLIPNTYGGDSTVDGAPSCDAPLTSVGDVSICTATVENFESYVGPSVRTFTVTLVDGHGHVRIAVQE